MNKQQSVLDSSRALPVASSAMRAKATPSTPGFRHAVRLQDSLTSHIERRALLWLAARLPAWVAPDHLTLLGFAAMLGAGCSYLLAHRHPVGLLLASLCLSVNWFGDSLDGTLARLRKIERPRYGFYVDHMIDSFGAIFLIGGLASSSYINWRIAAALLIGFFLLSVESYLASYTLGIFRLSFGKFGPTELRLLLAAANVALFVNPKMKVLWLPYRLFDLGGVIGAAAMATAVVTAALFHTAALCKEETRP